MTARTLSCMTSFGVLLLLAVGSAAQGPVLRDKTPVDSAATPSADGVPINIPVVVRDKHGDLVRNLTKDSFALQVDDRPQTIRDFDQDKDLPLAVGLV